MDRPKLTKKQKMLLDFIESFDQNQGFSPSYREIADGMGYRSIATVAEHINNLVVMGYLSKNNNSPRSLEVVQFGDNEPTVKSLQDQIKIRLTQLDALELNQVRKAFLILKIDELEEMVDKS